MFRNNIGLSIQRLHARLRAHWPEGSSPPRWRIESTTFSTTFWHFLSKDAWVYNALMSSLCVKHWMSYLWPTFYMYYATIQTADHTFNDWGHRRQAHGQPSTRLRFWRTVVCTIYAGAHDAKLDIQCFKIANIFEHAWNKKPPRVARSGWYHVKMRQR